MTPTKLPNAYIHPGVDRARAIDAEMADNYLAHTLLGDPLADAAVEALSSLSTGKSAMLVTAFMDDVEEKDSLGAPPELYAFFEEARTPPDWLDPADLLPAVKMFHRNGKLVLAAMVAAALVEGFSSLIAESFFITGRLRDRGVRRLQQNNRHMVELFFPFGMEHYGDGWKLSVRIRLIHAQVRYLLANSEDWDQEELGIPISSAHMGFAATAFSARLLKHLRSLGASFNEEEAASYMTVWRYSLHLMGTPASILYADEEHALKLFEVGRLCEPEVRFASVVLANSLLNSAPLVVGIEDLEERTKLVKYIYKVSRALIGNEMADDLKYPKATMLGVLPWFRLQSRYDATMRKLFSKYNRKSNFTTFTTILSGSRYDDEGISYRMPDHVHAEKSSQW